ncbi:hypothetical protein J6590_090193 [Homalodisca vitripennis]|nr:hypothetical protein J6590_090193 [Homalodisca vitripennis]
MALFTLFNLKQVIQEVSQQALAPLKDMCNKSLPIRLKLLVVPEYAVVTVPSKESDFKRIGCPLVDFILLEDLMNQHLEIQIQGWNCDSIFDVVCTELPRRSSLRQLRKAKLSHLEYYHVPTVFLPVVELSKHHVINQLNADSNELIFGE